MKGLNCYETKGGPAGVRLAVMHLTVFLPATNVGGEIADGSSYQVYLEIFDGVPDLPGMDIRIKIGCFIA
jgi:hypothetical protein